MATNTELTGFPRSNGRWGFRNYILLLPLHNALNQLVENVRVNHPANSVLTSVAHDWSGEVDADWDRIRRVFSGFAVNPNVGATIVVGIGSEAEHEIVERARAHREMPIAYLTLKEAGSFDALQSEVANSVSELFPMVASEKRIPAPWSAMVLGLECGGSDAYSGITANPALGVASDRLVELGSTSILAETMEILGAEHLLAARAKTPEVGQAIIDVVARYERSISYEGIDIRGAQPSRGNIEGGLTTLEEKSLGAAKKAGNAPFTGVLDYAHIPTEPGLYFMDTPGHDIEQLTGFAASDVNITVFTTGRGTPTGSAVIPTIKVATNTEMATALPDLIDLNAGTIADGTETVVEVGARIFDEIIAVANGKLPAAEVGGHREFNLSRLYGSTL
jgi:altronate dehydratase large subunit